MRYFHKKACGIVHLKFIGSLGAVGNHSTVGRLSYPIFVLASRLASILVCFVKLFGCIWVLFLKL